jgi:pimeloyl-ACP methyl ester carboxylesterase
LGRFRLIFPVRPDTFAPMGPIAVPKEDLPDVLTVSTKVNGQQRQKATTGDLIFSVPVLVETLSAAQTLQAGDVLASGTPAGVGFGLKPPTFLAPGDLVQISVSGLGTLANKIASPEAKPKLLEELTRPAVPTTNERTVNNNGLITIAGKQLSYRRKGGDNKPPMYFIHGLGGTADYFSPIMAKLGDSWTYHLSDFEGHGLSPSSASSKLSIASLASDAYQILSYAGVDSGVTVVAHSVGCLIAMRLALDHPELVKTLILQGPGASPLPEAASQATYARAALVREKGMMGVVDAVVGAGLSDYSKTHTPLAVAAARISLLGQDPEGYAKACVALADSHRDTLDVSALKARVLILTGAEDKVSPPEMCKKMKEKISHCEDVIVLPDVAHWHLFEKTEDVCSAVAQYLASS